MKHYFKYANGFVNINDENLFLTNSGNWSETHDLLEKSPKSIRKNNLKSNKISIYYFILGIFALIFVLNVFGHLLNKSVPVISIALLGLFFTAYKYMKSETGKRYKIPISKIKNIEISENQAKIIFLNEANIEDFEILNEVETKGIEIISKLYHLN